MRVKRHADLGENGMKFISRILAFMPLHIMSAVAAFPAQPEPKQMWLQTPASEMAEQMNWFSVYTMWFIVPITIFVLVLLLWVIIRFNAKANPVPSKTSHNALIEVIWTVMPLPILVAIAIPSFKLLDDQLAPQEEPQLTVKAIASQWKWDYEYQDGSELAFTSIMLTEDEKERAGYGKTDRDQYPRLLAVDNELVVPVGKMIRVLVTSDDVIHAFALPAFGMKIDAYKGRMNETWFKPEREGLYYGQCSELCGKDHAFMPIAIRVVSDADFGEWQKAAVEDLEGANKALMANIELKKNMKLAGN